MPHDDSTLRISFQGVATIAAIETVATELQEKMPGRDVEITLDAPDVTAFPSIQLAISLVKTSRFSTSAVKVLVPEGSLAEQIIEACDLKRAITA